MFGTGLANMDHSCSDLLCKHEPWFAGTTCPNELDGMMLAQAPHVSLDDKYGQWQGLQAAIKLACALAKHVCALSCVNVSPNKGTKTRPLAQHLEFDVPRGTQSKVLANGIK
eukprot:6480884-Amphidinium_carterae.2